MISSGQPFQDVCTKPPKWFRRVKDLFRADVAQRHIRALARQGFEQPNGLPWAASCPWAHAQAPPPAAAAVAIRACPAILGAANRARRLAVAPAVDRPVALSAAAPGRPGLPAIQADRQVARERRIAGFDPAATAIPVVAGPAVAVLAGLAAQVAAADRADLAVAVVPAGRI